MAILYWLAYGSNSKKLSRKNTDGVGVIVMVRNLKKTIHPPDFLVVEAALLSEIIDRLPFSPDWNKSQLLFVLSLGLPLEVTVLVKNVNKAKSPEHEVKGSGSGSSSFCVTLSQSYNLSESQ